MHTVLVHKNLPRDIRKKLGYLVNKAINLSQYFFSCFVEGRKRGYVLMFGSCGHGLVIAMPPPRLFWEVLGDTRKRFSVDQNYTF